jgi:hypothetical protein
MYTIDKSNYFTNAMNKLLLKISTETQQVMEK